MRANNVLSLRGFYVQSHGEQALPIDIKTDPFSTSFFEETSGAL